MKSEAQGQGLSKPLITYVLKRLLALGYTHVKLHTQTLSWLACKVYYDLGFRPTAQSLTENRFGWKMVELLTGVKCVFVAGDTCNRDGSD